MQKIAFLRLLFWFYLTKSMDYCIIFGLESELYGL